MFHRVYTRHGGVSEGAYASLNLGDGVGDDEVKVAQNRGLVETHGRLIWAKQVHGTTILSDTGVGDGFILDEPGVTAMIKHADCQAAIIYDPVRHVVANVHCGWRGSVQNIYRETIEQLRAKYRCRPENLFVGIGPSLCPISAEFVNYREELPESFWDYQATPDHFDFWAISEMQLAECGILSDHVEVARLSTYENADDFFSYRRDKTTGRHGTLASLTA